MTFGEFLDSNNATEEERKDLSAFLITLRLDVEQIQDLQRELLELRRIKDFLNKVLR